MVDQHREPSSPFDPDRIFASTDAGFRNAVALLILIGGSAALAIWVSPWFWTLVAAIVALAVALVVSRSHRPTADGGDDAQR